MGGPDLIFVSYSSLGRVSYTITVCYILITANASQHVQQTPPRTTNTPSKQPPQSTVANKTTIGHTTPMQTTSNHTSKPTKAAMNSSTTAAPTQTTTQHTPAAPNFGDVSQPDDSSGNNYALR